jgi:hydroxymethylpyrimidine/phosphomethylpyrimidine kinase
MSLMDDARMLRAIASSERIPFAVLRGLQSTMLDTNAVVKEIVGPNFGFFHGIGAASAALSAALDAAIACCYDWETAIHDAADVIEQAGS